MGHALLSPSSAGRWMNCPGAPQYESKFPDTTSEAAEEGTALHEVTESCILTCKPAETFLDVEVNGFTMTEERLVEVQKELDYFYSIYNPDIHELYVEKKMKTALIPQSGGTADVIMDELLGCVEVLDHKYGRRYVPPTTPQFKIYGAMSLENLPHGQDEVIMHVGQPRIDNFACEVMKAAELLEWVEDELKPAAELATSENPELHAGDHCLWCKAAHVCPELKRHNLEIAVLDFADDDPMPTELDDKELGHMLDRFPAVEAWMKEIRSVAFERAKAGKYPTGWKLVRGRSVRKWRNEEVVAKELKDIFGDNIYSPGKLLSVAQMEKMVGKDSKEELEKYWEKPLSYTLATEDDSREAVSSAADDFEEVG